MKTFLTLLTPFISLVVVSQSIDTTLTEFTINEEIQGEVEKRIAELEVDLKSHDEFLLYDNILIADCYENDLLTESYTEQEEKTMMFRSYYYAQGDTLSIEGVFGVFTGVGIAIDFIDGIPVVYNLLLGEDYPDYSSTPGGTPEERIKVPCSDSKLVLSKMPKVKDREYLYGYVEFRGGPFYQGVATRVGEEPKEDLELRMNMKIYFKAKYAEIDHRR